MFQVVTDSAADMPAEWLKTYNIKVIPINIHFKEHTYLQGIDLTNEQFYQLVDQSGVIPKTSQPTPQQFEDFYRNIAQPGDTILSLHVTGKLSGTFASAELAAQNVQNDFHVIPFDSGAGSVAMGYMCKEARLLAQAGASLKEIITRLEYIRKNVSIVLTLDTLEYAKMSGRVKTLQAALASILNVKPIVILRDGILDMAGKVRTRQRALEHILEVVRMNVGDRLVNAAVVHARDPKAGQALLQRVRDLLNCNELVLTELAISIAANLGPGTVGIVAYAIEN